MRKYVIPIIISSICFVVAIFLLKKVIKTNPTQVNLVLKIEVLENDLFQIFYWVKGDPNFNELNSVKQNVEGKEGIQTLVFPIPLDKDIERLRVDIGQNFEQKMMIIESVTLKANSNQIALSDSLLEYFYPSMYVTINNNNIYPKQINSNYDPYLKSKLLDKEMEYLKQKQPLIKVIYVIGFIFSITMFLFVLHMNFKLTFKGLSLKMFLWLFIFIIIFPSLSKYLHIEDEGINNEKRKLADKPNFELSKEFATKYEEYYNDHFGFRNTIIKWSSNVKTNLFKVSIKPKEVKFGNSQFLFYNKLSSGIYASYSNANLLTPDKLDEKIKILLERKNRLTKKGIKYVCAFWPNKHTIYSEYLPFSMSIQKKGTVSFANQLIDYSNSNGFPIIDVSRDLLMSKKDKQLYYKFDTHWNSAGAFVAYQVFFNQSFSELKVKPYTIDSFNVSYEKVISGDLTQMLAIDSVRGYVDQKPIYSLKDKTRGYVNLDAKGFPIRTVITRNENCDNRIKVLVFGDSYMTFLYQFFSLHFYEIIYIWGKYDEKIVESVSPDIVVSSYVERNFIGMFND